MPGAVATIHDGDPYTEGLAVVMANTFAGLNGEVVFQGAVSKGDTDMSAILTEIAASGPDVVYLPVFVPGIRIHRLAGAEYPGAGRGRDDDGGRQFSPAPSRRIRVKPRSASL